MTCAIKINDNYLSITNDKPKKVFLVKPICLATIFNSTCEAFLAYSQNLYEIKEMVQDVHAKVSMVQVDITEGKANTVIPNFFD